MDTFSYVIVRSWRRSIAIQIGRTWEVIVRAPYFVSEKKIRTFIEEKSSWVSGHIQKRRERNVPANILYYFGREYRIWFHENNFVSLSDEELFLPRKSHEACVLEWYKNQARKHIWERVQYFSEQYGFCYASVRITSAKTRWGSCSSKNHLNFSWRLIMAPVEVIDYVVVHELSHTVHMDHSIRFWNLVESIIPDWRERRNFLKVEGWKYDIKNTSP